MRLFICAAIAAAALVGPGQGANAQQPYPTRPITVVVPFAAGGPTDVLARILGQHMSQTLGQQIVVENVTGGGGLDRRRARRQGRARRLHPGDGQSRLPCRQRRALQESVLRSAHRFRAGDAGGHHAHGAGRPQEPADRQRSRTSPLMRERTRTRSPSAAPAPARSRISPISCSRISPRRKSSTCPTAACRRP